MSITCPYCDEPARPITGLDLYANPLLAAKKFWRCDPCDAHVGCHAPGNGYGDGTVPLGTMANAALRRARNAAHAALDPLWQSGPMTRHGAYGWLARTLGIEQSDCHIALFSEERCAATVSAVEEMREATQPPPPKTGLVIYSDGSVYPNPGDGGWAFVVYDDGVEIHSTYGGERETTNNRMEMLGIIKALEWVKDRPCEIHSDSELCVNTLNTWAKSWQKRGWRKADGKAPMNADLVRYAYPLYLGSKAKLKWVRGHAGNFGNERADRLALQGRLSVTAKEPA